MLRERKMTVPQGRSRQAPLQETSVTAATTRRKDSVAMSTNSDMQSFSSSKFLGLLVKSGGALRSK